MHALKENVVLIADRIFLSYDNVEAEADTLEMIPDEYFFQIFEGLSAISKSVTHYNTLEEFIDNVQQHKDDLVFTIYGGRRSRNRMALVPAICESYGIKFVGADTYARIVCQDKQISKEVIRRFELKTAEYLLIDHFTDMELLQTLNYPLVIKPNMEGSSIGIHAHSRVSNYIDAKALSLELLKEFKEAVIAEEFLSGHEVCVCVSGDINEVKLMEPMEVYAPSDNDYFINRLYTAYDKHVSDLSIEHRPIFINERDIEKLKRIFLSFGKMDYMRIDGRVKDGIFYLIELTPDAHLGKTSSFADAFKKNGLEYKDMLLSFTHNALTYYQNPYSNV
jgi:D-alanine-D-alanine ligase